MTRRAANYGKCPGNPLADGHTFAKKIQSAPKEFFYKIYPTTRKFWGEGVWETGTPDVWARVERVRGAGWW